MKTIEERAKAYLHKEITQPTSSEMYDAYKDGAHDQKQIDIEKALRWFKENMTCKTETEYQDVVSHFIKTMENDF